jgi:uncharacterized protein with HEPN domain
LRPDDDYLGDILRAIDLIGTETRGLDRESFVARFGQGFSPFAAAVGFALIVVGEACAGLLKRRTDLPTRRPEVDWRGFVKLRHVVAHQYFRVRADLVWGVVQDELPLLERAVRAEVARE